MTFHEINIFGVYLAPISLMIVAAFVAYVALRRAGTLFGLERQVWHPALVDMAVYAILLALLVLGIARWGR
jgi:protein AaeX